MQPGYGSYVTSLLDEVFLKPLMEIGMSEWRDIATAPGDGTRLLVYNRHVGQWVAYFDLNWQGCPVWSTKRYEMEPTHWMPLPPPPTED